MSSGRFNRRQFLHHGAMATGAVAGLAVIPRPLTAMFNGRPEPVPSIRDSRIKELVLRGVDAAKSAGASYADVRMTHTRKRGTSGDLPWESESLHASARALVDGYWGFAASPVWSSDEIARLGHEAVLQAKAASFGKPRSIVLPPVTPVVDGHWATPVRIDPFEIHPQEICNYLQGLKVKVRNEIRRLDRFGDGYGDRGRFTYEARVQEKAFGSTLGTYCTQRLVRSEGEADCGNSNGVQGDDGYRLTPAGVGWELYLDTPVVDILRESIEYYAEIARLPVKPIDVGRYETVFDSYSVARLLSTSVGPATEIDRVLGYEANAGGTSYLTDPDETLRTFRVGSDQLTVAANRNEPGGLATVQWDDEGVEPQSFTLVDRGMLVGFHTSREGAGWLQPTYTRVGIPFRSAGCMTAETAGDVPYIRVANLSMQPGVSARSLQDIEQGIGKGMSVAKLVPQMDFQMINGFSNQMSCFEIKNGKRVARVANAGMLFRTPEIWNSILALGGQASAQRFGTESVKGEPKQSAWHSMTTVPIAVKELTFIDRERR